MLITRSVLMINLFELMNGYTSDKIYRFDVEA